MDRDIEKDCIDDKGHRIIYEHQWKKCEKCGWTWFYTNDSNPTKIDDEKLGQSIPPTSPQKYRD